MLNKAGGIYGLLSLFTGHHLNFWQWLYNLLALATLPFYVLALSNLSNKANNVRKLCLACSIYLADTVLGFLYTIYFVHFWFSREDTKPTELLKRALGTAGAEIASKGGASLSTVASESASPAREMFLTVSGVLLTVVLRIYFCLVFVSFTRRLLINSIRNQRDHGHDSLGENAMHEDWLGRIKRAVHALENRAKHKFTDFAFSGI